MSPLTSYRVFETSDLDEGSRFAGQIWEHNRAELVEGSYGLRWNHTELNQSTLSYIEHDCSVDLVAQGPISDHFRIFFHKRGSIQHMLNGQQVVSDSANVIAHAPGIDLQFNIQPFELLLVSLRGEFVRKALAQRFDRLPALETWVGVVPHSPCVDTLQTMTAWLCNELERPGSPLLEWGKPRLHAERMLLSTFVECLAHMAPQEIGAVPDIGERQVHEAEDWIDEHVTEVVGVEEIARAVGVGVRSLQRTFRRVRGYAPGEALLRRRLERARQALLAATPEATVSSIASEYGFFELSRFARRYRAHYGEKPSQTLARRIKPSVSG